MKLKRFVRAVAAWWWIAILVGLLGLGAGAFAVQQRNSSITRVYQAQAYFPIVAVVTGQRGEVSSGPLQDALRRATEINSDLLVEGKVAITANQDQYALVFSARGSDAEAATAMVEKMRVNFVTAEYGAVSIEDRLDLMVNEAVEVSASIHALEPTTVTTPTPQLDPEAQARLDFLLIQVGALKDESSKLVGNLVLAETGEDRNGTPAEIQAQIASVGDKLEAIYLELETTEGFEPEMLEETAGNGQPTQATGSSSSANQGSNQGASQGRTTESTAGRSTVSIPDDQSEIGPDWQKAALESRYAELQTQFQNLFEQSIDDEPDDLAAATTTDATPEAFPVIFGAAGGFGLGLLLGVVLILLIGKLLKPIWAAIDMSPVVFYTEVPAGPSKIGNRSGHKRLDKRERAIRAFRSTVNGVLEEEGAPMSIGLVGVGARAGDTRQLAVELGNSLQAVDRAVLVIDVDFQSSSRNVASSDNTVAGLLELVRANSEYADGQVKQILAELTSGESGVRVLPAGTLNEDPADTLLSRAFSQLLAEALSYVDVVLIPILDASQSAADSLFQRLNAVVAVCQSGSGRRRELATLIWRLDQRSAELLGGVLLVGRGRRRSERSRRDKASPLSPSGPRRGPGKRKELVGTSVAAGLSPSEARSINERIPAKAKALMPLRTESRQAKAKARGRVSNERWMALPGISTQERSIEPDTQAHDLPKVKAGSISLFGYKSRLAKARVRVRVPTSRWRALPDFLVIGAQRSGTSSLYKYLGQHPSVVPSIRKETEFFTSRHDEGEDWYRAHFPLKLGAPAGADAGRRLTFEADPSYLLDPRAPVRASRMVPDAKIVVLLRDPVARAISHYNHNVRIGQEDASLSEALDLEESRLRGEVERMFHDPEYPAKPYLRYSYATRGLYAEQLERWLEFYPAERVRVVHSADLFENTPDVYQWILDFLEIPHWQPRTFSNFSYIGNGNGNGNGNGTSNGNGADPNVEQRLRELFAPYNDRLYTLIDQDFGW